MDETFDLPIFPLNTVVFPDQPLSLRVFEPRYRALVSHCLAGDTEFGITLIREGKEIGGPAVPFRIGTTVSIVHHQTDPLGHIQLVVLGQRRFRILELLPGQPFPAARARAWPWAGDPPPDHGLVSVTGRLLRRYVHALTDTQETNLTPETTPRDPLTLGRLAAIVLQIPQRQKQALLETATSAELLSNVAALLQAQIQIAEHTKAFGPSGPSAFQRISWN